MTVENPPRRLRERRPLHPQPTSNGIQQNTEQEIIRCPCGSLDDFGVMIECEECKTWQHKSCMSIPESSDVTATKYNCDRCDPRAWEETEKKKAAASAKQKQIARNARDHESILEFLDEQTIGVSVPLVLAKFFEDYKKHSGCTATIRSLQLNFRKANGISAHPMYDEEAKARMMYATSTPIKDAEFLNKLRLNAIVEVDKMNRIVKYESTRGGLRLSAPPKKIATRKKNRATTPPAKVATPKPTARKAVSTRSVRPVGPALRSSAKHLKDVKMEEEEEEVDELDTPPSLPDDPKNAMFPFQNVFSAMGNPLALAQNVNPLDVNNGFFAGTTNFMMSMTGMMQTQTNMMREMTRLSALLHPSTASGSTSSESENTSVKEFLKFLQIYIVSLDSMHLADVNHQIMIEIQKMGVDDKLIPMNTLKITYETIYAIVRDHTAGVSMIESTLAKDFLKHILIYATSQNHKELTEICEKIRKAADGIDATNTIPLDKLRLALEAAIGIVL